MTFKDLTEFFDGSLRLPIAGKEYVIPPISADDGIWVTALITTASKVAAGGKVDEADAKRLTLDDGDERELYERVLGTAFEEMRVDGVNWPSISHAGQTAMVFFAQGEDAAEKVWHSLGEAEAPNRATRRASKATASSTPRRGSTSGTRSRKS